EPLLPRAPRGAKGRWASPPLMYQRFCPWTRRFPTLHAVSAAPPVNDVDGQRGQTNQRCHPAAVVNGFGEPGPLLAEIIACTDKRQRPDKSSKVGVDHKGWNLEFRSAGDICCEMPHSRNKVTKRQRPSAHSVEPPV